MNEHRINSKPVSRCLMFACANDLLSENILRRERKTLFPFLKVISSRVWPSMIMIIMTFLQYWPFSMFEMAKWLCMPSSFSPAGLMRTKDELSSRYFLHTAVTCVMHPRKNCRNKTGGWKGFLGCNFTHTCYTHHQKTIIMDAPGAACYDNLTIRLWWWWWLQCTH